MEKLNFGNRYFVHELTAVGSFEETYIISDSNGEKIATATEQASFASKLAKMFLDKALVPATLHIKDNEGKLLIKLEQELSFPHTNFTVRNSNDECEYVIKQKLSLLGSYFAIYNADMENIASLTGDFRNKNYVLKRNDGIELASIKHKNSGVFRDFLTTADDYEIELSNSNDKESLLSLIATLCVDFAFHES